MKGFRVWSDYWKKYATEAELYMDGSVDAIFEDDDGVPHHENADLVVEFSTGLKDKNGKEIYEGDIVWFKWTKRLYVVTYREYDASFILENDKWEETIHLSLDKDDFEVFGNIHENPELLEDEKMSKYKGLFTFDVENHRYLSIEQADGIITDMDYHPEPESKEPLIKDEKIRKAVRAWAEACNLKHVTYKQASNEFYDADTRGAFAIRFRLIPVEVYLEDNEVYTIAELCGEEEE